MTQEDSKAGDIVAIARAAYEAYVSKDRAAIEALIAPDFHFTSPLDNRIDRATYFARCWPNSEMMKSMPKMPLDSDWGIQGGYFATPQDAETFESLRPLLLAIAYRMLGR